jgi:hypothetical protein
MAQHMIFREGGRGDARNHRHADWLSRLEGGPFYSDGDKYKIRLEISRKGGGIGLHRESGYIRLKKEYPIVNACC